MQQQSASSETFVKDVIDSGKVSGQQLLVIGLCFLFNMLDGFDITAMAVVAGAVADDLGMASDQLGWIFSFALAGMMAGAMVLAPLSDLIGRRRMIILSVVLVGASVLLTAQAASLWEFIVLRFLAGLGAGAMLASQATLADEYSPEKYRTLAVTVVTSGYPAGAMMTSVVAGFIVPEFGWRGMFWFGGAVTLALTVVAWLFIPESLKFLVQRRPDGALDKVNRILRKLKKPQVAALPRISEDVATPGGGFVEKLLLLVAPEHRSVTLRLWATFFLVFTSLYFLFSWVPKLVEDAGFSAADGRHAFFLMNLGAISGIYILGIVSTRVKITNLIAVFFAIAAAGMVFYANVPANLDLMLVLIFFVGLFQQGGFTAMYSVAAKAYPTKIRSTGVGWAIGLGRLGAVAGPAVAGYLIAGGLDMSANFIIFAIPMAICALLAYWLNIR